VFEKIAIGIKTFLRDAKLVKAINGIISNMPGAQIIIADDGEETPQKYNMYSNLVHDGHKVGVYPFDSGFGFKSNKIISMLDRPYLLIGSDDFDFTLEAASGVKAMIEIMEESHPGELDILSGRLNGRTYEFNLEDRGDTIIEHKADTNFKMMGKRPRVYLVDLTVNYSLIRREVFDKVKFDNEEIIGEGGHGAFFVDCKRAGLKVGFTPLAEINEQHEPEDSARYRQYRARANSPSRKTFDRRGIKKYVLGSGQVDYDITNRH
jgi:hypothetical protein